MKQSGHTAEPLRIPRSLLVGLQYVQAFASLDLNMYTRQACDIRDSAKGEEAAPLHVISVCVEKGSKLPLPRCALTL